MVLLDSDTLQNLLLFSSLVDFQLTKSLWDDSSHQLSLAPQSNLGAIGRYMVMGWVEVARVFLESQMSSMMLPPSRTLVGE